MILQYSYCAADAKWNRGHLEAEAPAQSPGPLGLFSVHLSPLGLGGVVATDYAGLVQEGQAVVSGAVDPAGSDSPLLIADHCLAVYPCSKASLYIRVSRRCRCVRTSPSSVTATQRSVLVGQGPNARHIRSAWSMRSVTTLHKYEQQRYRSRTPRLQPSLAHLRLRLGLGLGVSMGSPGVVRGVHPKTSSRLLVSTLNKGDDYNDCDGRGLTTKSAKSLLAEP